MESIVDLIRDLLEFVAVMFALLIAVVARLRDENPLTRIVSLLINRVGVTLGARRGRDSCRAASRIGYAIRHRCPAGRSLIMFHVLAGHLSRGAGGQIAVETSGARSAKSDITPLTRQYYPIFYVFKH